MPPTSLYRPIFQQALQFTWRFKALWFFGAFTALLAGNGEYQLLLRNLAQLEELPTRVSFAELWRIDLFLTAGQNLWGLLLERPLAIGPVVLIILAVLAFLIWLAIASQGALVDAAARSAKGETIGFRKHLDAAQERFWTLLGLNAVGRLLAYLLLIAIGTPLLLLAYARGGAWGATLGIVSFVLLVPAAVVISFVTKLAVSYAMVQGERFWPSLELGWQLFGKHWLICLEMALWLLGINVAVIIAFLLAGFALVLPPLALALLFAISGFNLLSQVSLAAMLLLFLALLVFLTATYATFLYGSWTLLWLQLTERNPLSKLVRVIAQLPALFQKQAAPLVRQMAQQMPGVTGQAVAATGQVVATVQTAVAQIAQLPKVKRPYRPRPAPPSSTASPGTKVTL